MIAPSFRLKLLLGMMLSVAVVTVATLFVTQRKVQATYERLFREQFESQIHFVTEAQAARLEYFKEQSLVMAGNVRLITALQELGVKEIYDHAYDHFAVARLPGRDPSPPSARPAGLREVRSLLGRQMRQPPFIRFLDATGAVLHPPDQQPRAADNRTNRRLQRQLAGLVRHWHRLEQQQVGYVTPEDEAGRSQLMEIILTRIADHVTGETAGALVLGFPITDALDRALSSWSHLRSAVWLDGELHSTSIPSARHAELSVVLAREIRGATNAHGDFTVSLEGAPYRVFHRLLNPDSPFPPAHQVCLYSLSGLAETLADLRARILLFAGGALLVALALSWFIAHGLSIPLRELVAGTGEIQRGNFAVRVPVRSRDEVGQLAGSFNEMAGGLALKEKYRSVLNLVADKTVAEELVRGGVALGGERREAAILFCDIRGFTALTQGMPPEDVIRLLNDHMTALTRVVYEHGGVVDKFVGDLLMAVFGAPRGTARDAENAARCALRMIEERNKLNADAAHKIRVGLGVVLGDVVAGCMGSSDRLNYTVLGERVNLASRLCSLAGPDEIVIDAALRERLGAAARTEPLPPAKLKGFAEEVQAWRLTGFDGTDERPTTMPG